MNERTRQLIKQETNIELLKELLLKTFEYTERLQKDYQAEVDRRAKLAQQKFNVDEQYLILKKKFFGKSSEKTPIQDRLRGEMESDIDLLAHSQSLVPKPNNKQTKELEKQVLEYECTPEELKEMSESLGLESPSADQWEKMEGFYERSKEVWLKEVTNNYFTASKSISLKSSINKEIKLISSQPRARKSFYLVVVTLLNLQ